MAGLAAVGGAVATLAILLTLSVADVYHVAIGTAIAMPLIMGFLAGQAVWKGLTGPPGQQLK